MSFKTQKRLAASIIGCSPKHIRFDTEQLDEIKESITKSDIRSLIKDRIIYRAPSQQTSRVRARKIIIQKRKGQQKGSGSRKGKPTSRLARKTAWMANVRAQRVLLATLKESMIITKETYRDLYRKSQGGFFRNRRHLKLYIEEHKLVNKKQ